MSDYVVRLRNYRTLRIVRPLAFDSISWTRGREGSSFVAEVPLLGRNGEPQLSPQLDLVPYNVLEVLRSVDGGRTWRHEFAGSLGKSPSDEDSLKFVLSGLSTKSFWLSSRIIVPPEGQEYDAVEGVPAETAILHYLNANLIAPADEERAVSNDISAGFPLPADRGRGSLVSYNGRHQFLLEMAQQLSLSGDVIDDMTISGSEYRYSVKSPVDKTQKVIFSLDRQQLSNATYEDDYMRRVNAVYALGTGSGADRVVEVVTDETSIASTLRRETVLDVRDGTTTDLLRQAALTHMAERDLEARRAGVVLAGTAIEQYRQKWDVGDDVTVNVPRLGVSLTRRIEAVTVTLDNANYETVSIQLGKPPLGLAGALADLQKKINKIAVA